MKFLCPACERLVPIGAHRLEGTTLFLRCSACGVERAANDAASTPLGPNGGALTPSEVEGRAEDPFAVPAGRCPKCISVRRPDAIACSQCGLTFAAAKAEDYRPAASLSLAWRELLNRWTDSAAHERFLAGAAARVELSGAGRLYRLKLAQSPGDAFASRGRDEVLRLASVPSALGTPSPPPELMRSLPVWTIPATAVLFVGFILFLLIILRR